MKLKTLKDIELRDGQTIKINKDTVDVTFSIEDAYKEILKQEAIKQLKQLNKTFPRKVKKDEGFHTFLINRSEMLGAINWIKHFFNITDEDLK